MVRVLRPGGLLVLADLGRCSPWAAWRRMRGWAGNATWHRAWFWTLRDLQALVRGAGLGGRSVWEARHDDHLRGCTVNGTHPECASR